MNFLTCKNAKRQFLETSTLLMFTKVAQLFLHLTKPFQSKDHKSWGALSGLSRTSNLERTWYLAWENWLSWDFPQKWREVWSLSKSPQSWTQSCKICLWGCGRNCKPRPEEGAPTAAPAGWPWSSIWWHIQLEPWPCPSATSCCEAWLKNWVKTWE